ncbi:MAG: hypothetical protein KIB40_00010 [Pantoea sp.]|uniref:hypothetical protein n=1 Tax=Pantoea sp. TaxID=69393 RepID=UPI00257D73C2|nr:hypothetical protein [Pantoea sp.]MBS6031527.1 hypothetical protein [Pantoea sp.]
MNVFNEDLKFSEDYVDAFSDLVLPGAMKIGNEDFFRLTFVKHMLTPTSIPSNSGQQIPVSLVKEAQCSVSIPMSVAEELVKAIQSLQQSQKQEP